MIRSFHNRGTEYVFNGFSTKAARKTCPEELARTAGDKLDRIDDAVRLEDLRIPPGNRLELLKGDRAGQHSIRINGRYRICFVWTDDGASDVQIVDYHY
ncbi:MAG TPA: type II toxin-antitoxin system RelE/ParE family toxin [Gemmatimonadaceae bacterium]|nr:type II toxin-antitoxin system RelE/ParE family toxin [Gemmatimonadaceae bacterium]